MNLIQLAEQIHKDNQAKGFYEDPATFGERIALAHSELSEALESHRADEPSIWWKNASGKEVSRIIIDNEGIAHEWGATGPPLKPEGFATELADCLIRILDSLYYLGVDPDEIVRLKMAYNRTRPRKHGKRY